MKKTISISFLILLCALLCNAQDLHFSQLFFNAQNLNAAEIGVFDGDIRAFALQRNQWKSIPVPYKTSTLSVDFKNSKKLKHFNPALVFNYDKSGDSKYTQTQLLFGLSRIIKLKKDSTFLLSVGNQFGFFSNSFQTNNLSFDNQYDGTQYNPALSSGENFPNQTITKPDVNVGLLLSYQILKRSKIFSGISAQHIFNAKASFFSDKQIKTNLKIIYYLRAELNFKNGRFLLPYLGFIQREKNKEFQLGSSFGFELMNTKGNTIKPYMGFFYRNKDAYFIQFGTFYNQFNFAFSYDINYSGLKVATSNRGAVEFVLVYIFKKPQSFIIQKKFCPVFL